MLIVLTKLGRNCQVVFYNQSNDNTQTFQEDSANVECTYNVLNDVVSVAIKGRTQATTTSIVDNDVLYINTGTGDILIKTYADYLINYALLFLNGGGGPGTTPNLQQVVNVGNDITDNTNINLFNSVYGGPIFNSLNVFGITGFDQRFPYFENYSYGKSFALNYVNPNDTEDINNIGFEFILKEGFKFYNTSQINNIETRLFADYNVIKTQYLNDNLGITLIDKGLKLDLLNNEYILGDFDSGTCFFQLDASTGFFRTFYNSQLQGLEMNFSTNIYKFGDFDGIHENTYIFIDDNKATLKIWFNNNSGYYNFAAVNAYTDNADALANGLIVGDIYRHAAGGLESADQLRIVH